MNYKVHLVLEHDRDGEPHGASIIRLLRPFLHPRLVNHLDVSCNIDLTDEKPDLVVVDRAWRPDVDPQQADALVRGIRSRGARFVYFLDDNLVDLHQNEPWQFFPNHNQRSAVRLFLRKADLVMVSTPALRSRFLTLNPDIVVIPNALDETLFPTRDVALGREQKGPFTIGYMGTLTHTEDLMLVVEPLRELLRANPDSLRLELLGVTTEPRIRELFSGLPLKILSPGTNVAYERFVRWAQEFLRWDLAIAPLEDRLFNRFKSDIKFLDYALLGFPAVCSNVEAYRHTVVHSETGWLSDNDPECWYRTIADRIENTDELKRVREQAWEYANKHRCLSTGVKMWLQAVERVMNSH